MAGNTDRFGLLKKDPTTEGTDTFNIKTMLNDNWDKLDAAAKKTELDTAIADAKEYTDEEISKIPQLDLSEVATKQELQVVDDKVTNVQQELDEHSVESATNAHIGKNIGIEDVGDYYASDNVEGALQEIGYTFNGSRGSLIESVNGILGG